VGFAADVDGKEQALEMVTIVDICRRRRSVFQTSFGGRSPKAAGAEPATASRCAGPRTPGLATV
jgi:hypothetical protein